MRTSYAYVGLSITVTNDKGQTQTSEKNAAGQVVRTTDGTGAQLASLYGPFGNLLKTVDPLGNTLAMAYDIRGHKLSLQDPDAGLWQYDYDALGELVWQQNANQRAASQSTTMTFDALGRMTQRSEPEYISTWTYDKYSDGSACTKGIGKLCDVVTTNGSRRKVTFDSIGRAVTTQLIVTSGPTFTSSVAYDAANGRVVSQTYPTGLSVTLGYTTLGYFQRPANTAGNATLWQAQAVNAWGAADSQVFGNGVQTRKVFDGMTGRVAEIDADPGNNSNAVMRHRYGYDAIDNLVSRIDDDGAGDGNAVSEWFAFHQIPAMPIRVFEGRHHIVQDWLFDYLSVDRTAITAADRAVYAAAYDSPESLRAVEGWFSTLDTDIADFLTYDPLKIPVLGLGGISHPFLAAFLAIAAPQAVLVDMPQTGHWVPDAQPEETIRLLFDFIG